MPAHEDRHDAILSYFTQAFGDLRSDFKEAVNELKADIKQLGQECPGHRERTRALETKVESLESSVDRLWGRFWWALGLGVLSMVSVIGFLVEAVIKKLLA